MPGGEADHCGGCCGRRGLPGLWIEFVQSLAQERSANITDCLDLVGELDREHGLEVAPGHLLDRRRRGGECGVVGLLGLGGAAEALAEEKLDRGDAGADVGDVDLGAVLLAAVGAGEGGPVLLGRLRERRRAAPAGSRPATRQRPARAPAARPRGSDDAAVAAVASRSRPRSGSRPAGSGSAGSGPRGRRPRRERRRAVRGGGRRPRQGRTRARRRAGRRGGGRSNAERSSGLLGCAASLSQEQRIFGAAR